MLTINSISVVSSSIVFNFFGLVTIKENNALIGQQRTFVLVHAEEGEEWKGDEPSCSSKAREGVSRHRAWKRDGYIHRSSLLRGNRKQKGYFKPWRNRNAKKQRVMEFI